MNINPNFLFLVITLSIITLFISIFILSVLFLLLKIGLVSFKQSILSYLTAHTFVRLLAKNGLRLIAPFYNNK